MSTYSTPTDQYPNHTTPPLNNFFLHFAIGAQPYDLGIPQGYYRQALMTCWDTPFRTIFSCFQASVWALHSNRYLDQTPHEFYEVLDAVVVDAGMSPEEIRQAVNTFMGEREHNASPAVMESLLWPVFLRMKEAGYTDHDLLS